MRMRQTAGRCAVTVCVLRLWLMPTGAAEDRLLIMQGDYPRAFFFRAAEASAADKAITYPQWEAAC